MPANYNVSKATFAANRDLPAEIIAALDEFLQADVDGPELRASVGRPLSATADLTAPGTVNAGTDILTFGNFRTSVDLDDLGALRLSNLEVIAFNGSSSRTVDLGAFSGVVLLGRGNDTVTKSVVTGDVAVNAGDGRDTVTTGTGDDTVNAGTGADSVFTAAGNDLVIGGEGADSISTGIGNDTVFGGDGNDQITDTSGSSFVDGGSGNDTIRTGAGADTIFAGSGNDSVVTGAGNDTVYTGGGNDTILTGSNNDLIVLQGITSGAAILVDGEAGILDTLDLSLVNIASAQAAGVAGTTITLDNGAVINVSNVERFLYTDSEGSAELVGLTAFLNSFT
jgi:Ca2+-binding RTX toxin-like protein